MNNKKGLSEVVTTVLIVLLTIVAIGILWAFLQPVLTKSGTKVAQTEACMAISIETTRCTVDANVTVKRGAGEANLKAIKLIFLKNDGSTKSISINDSAKIPDELGSVVYKNASDYTLDFSPKSVTIAAGLADSSGVIGYCGATPSIACV